jgi:hypothetical protein
MVEWARNLRLFRWTGVIQRDAINLASQGAEPGAYAEAVRTKNFSAGKFIKHGGSLMATDRYRSEVELNEDRDATLESNAAFYRCAVPQSAESR